MNTKLGEVGCIGFVCWGLVAGGGGGQEETTDLASLKSCQKLPPCPSQLQQIRAEPISNTREEEAKKMGILCEEGRDCGGRCWNIWFHFSLLWSDLVGNKLN